MRLIDADALLESFDVAWMWEYDETGCGVRKKAIPTKTIEEAPTIDAEPVRHGRWGEAEIVGYDGIHPVYAAPCSYCGQSTLLYKPNYCPHCGAKMDAKEK